MGRICLGLIIAGIAAIFFGWQDWQLSRLVKSEPQSITCAALGQTGYGDNAHVQVTNTFLSPGGYVYQERGRGSTSWAKVWIPLIDIDSAYADSLRVLPEGTPIPGPTNFNVIMQTEHVSDLSELRSLSEADSFTGIVINKIDSLDSDTKRLLRESYPGVDLERCWILDHNRSKPSAARGLGLLVLGLSVLGGMIAYWYRKRRADVQPPTDFSSYADAQDPRRTESNAPPRTPTRTYEPV